MTGYKDGADCSGHGTCTFSVPDADQLLMVSNKTMQYIGTFLEIQEYNVARGIEIERQMHRTLVGANTVDGSTASSNSTFRVLRRNFDETGEGGGGTKAGMNSKLVDPANQGRTHSDFGLPRLSHAHAVDGLHRALHEYSLNPVPKPIRWPVQSIVSRKPSDARAGPRTKTEGGVRHFPDIALGEISMVGLHPDEDRQREAGYGATQPAVPPMATEKPLPPNRERVGTRFHNPDDVQKSSFEYFSPLQVPETKARTKKLHSEQLPTKYDINTVLPTYPDYSLAAKSGLQTNHVLSGDSRRTHQLITPSKSPKQLRGGMGIKNMAFKHPHHVSIWRDAAKQIQHDPGDIFTLLNLTAVTSDTVRAAANHSHASIVCARPGSPLFSQHRTLPHKNSMTQSTHDQNLNDPSGSWQSVRSYGRANCVGLRDTQTAALKILDTIFHWGSAVESQSISQDNTSAAKRWAILDDSSGPDYLDSVHTAVTALLQIDMKSSTMHGACPFFLSPL